MWTIVDSTELLKKVTDGTLHQVSCPFCATPDTIDSPLLLVRPRSSFEMVFVPADRTTPDEDWDAAKELSKGRSSSREPNVWIPRHLIGQVLRNETDGNPEIDLVLRAAAASPVAADVADAVSTLLRSRTDRDFVNVIESFPFLLTDTVDTALLAAAAELARGDESAAPLFTRQLSALRLFRKVGVSRALARRAEERTKLLGGPGELPPELASQHREFQHENSQPGHELKAIKLLERLLTRIDRDAFPRHWGQLHGMLGQLLMEARSTFGRGERVERAIAAYTVARDTHAAMRSVDWGWAQRDLGRAYLQRRKGTPADNVDEAVGALEAAAQCFSQLREYHECGTTLVMLSDVVLRHRTGADALRGAIAMLQQVLTLEAADAEGPSFAAAVQRLVALLGRLSDPGLASELGAVHHSLGRAHLNRALASVGDRAATVDTALSHLSDAVRIHSERQAWALWADAKVAIGCAYRFRANGFRGDNLTHAIEALTAGLQHWPKEYAPEVRSRAHYDLALAYADHPSVENRWALARAELSRALDLLTGPMRAQNQPLIAQALAHVAVQQARDTDDHADWLRAHDDIDGALALVSPITHPWIWAEMQQLLGAILAALGATGHLPSSEALTSFESLLSIYTLDRAPQQRRIALSNLGTLYARKSDWSSAEQAFRGAVQASERALDLLVTEWGRLTEAREAGTAFDGLAYALVMLDRLDEAFTVTQQSAARLVGEWIKPEALQNLDDEALARLDHARQTTRMMQGNGRRALDDKDRLPDDKRMVRLREAESILRSFTDGLPARPAVESDGAAIFQGGLVDAVVVPLITPIGSVVFVVPAGTGRVGHDHVVLLPQLTDHTLQTAIRGTVDDPGWMVLRSVLQGDTGREEDVEFRKRFDRSTQGVLLYISEHLVAPIVERLLRLSVPPDANVGLVVSGDLAAVPIHAAPLADGRVLLDAYAISYVPSLLMLSACRRRAARIASRRREDDRWFVVADPARNLPGARVEADNVARIGTNVAIKSGSAATVDAVVAEAPGAAYLHFACHGYYDMSSPFRSGLVMADGEILTVDSITQRLRLRSTRLAVLSACGSGATDFVIAPKEVLGAPTAFLESGVAGVLGAMWTVGDADTIQVMTRFYQLHFNEGLAPAHALRAAQLEARRRSTYSGPYQWGPFFMVGV